MNYIRQQEIVDLLGEGRSEAVSSTEIAEAVGIDEANGNPISRFELRDILKRGIPVVASSEGYFIAETEEEVEEYLTRLDQRIRGIEERKELLREAVVGEELHCTAGDALNEDW